MPSRVLWIPLGLLLLVPAGGGAQSTSPGAMVVDVPGDSLYHQPGCPLVVKAGSKVKVLKQADAVRQGLKPHDCSAMDPEAAGPDPNAQPVFVQPDDNKYHKEGCRKLGAKATTLPLDKAGRSHWPCPVCKPPIRKPPGRKL